VLAIERDPITFSSCRAPRPHGRPLPMMICMDNPEHQRRRSLVSRGFTPRRVAGHRATVERLAMRILDGVCERGECDLVWDVAAPLPLLLIADLLGFDDALHDDLLRWSDDLLRATTNDLSPEVADAGLRAMLGFRECQMDVIRQRRIILIGGDETTRHVISGGMLALLERPDQADVLLSNDDAMSIGVEELLRWVSPVKNMARTVTRDVEVRGQQLRAGDQLILFYPSANRDEDVFVEPDRLDVRRDPNPHLAFGFGSHFCLGASLARLELTVMFREVLRRLPDIRLAGEVPFRHSNFISGPEAMPVEFTPTARAA
jgi:cytochrome P450 family 142 subfamily A polypeptide 1